MDAISRSTRALNGLPSQCCRNLPDPAATVPAADPITVCFRIQLVTDRNVTGTPFSLFNSTASAYEDARHIVRYGVELRTNAANSAPSADLAAGTWYHVAYVRSGSGHTLYGWAKRRHADQQRQHHDRGIRSAPTPCHGLMPDLRRGHLVGGAYRRPTMQAEAAAWRGGARRTLGLLGRW